MIETSRLEERVRRRRLDFQAGAGFEETSTVLGPYFDRCA
jgi:succinate dehydrogenase flavin-adding protein (antitoxin of CptAB toxin-antitoxin module)